MINSPSLPLVLVPLIFSDAVPPLLKSTDWFSPFRGPGALFPFFYVLFQTTLMKIYFSLSSRVRERLFFRTDKSSLILFLYPTLTAVPFLLKVFFFTEPANRTTFSLARLLTSCGCGNRFFPPRSAGTNHRLFPEERAIPTFSL